VKHHEDIESRFVQCESFSKQRKLLKYSPLGKLESACVAWFKKAHESKASIDGTHFKEKALHIATHLGGANFRIQVDGLTDLRGDTTLITELHHMRAGVLTQKL
jgi:hypothetical protein